MNAGSKPEAHADVATTALRQALAESHAPLRAAVAAYRTACAGLTPDADLLAVLRAAGGIVLAAEAITAEGKQTEAAARAAMASLHGRDRLPRRRAR